MIIEKKQLSKGPLAKLTAFHGNFFTQMLTFSKIIFKSVVTVRYASIYPLSFFVPRFFDAPLPGIEERGMLTVHS